MMNDHLSSPSGGRLLDIFHLLFDNRSATRMSRSIHPKDEHDTNSNDEGCRFVHLLQKRAKIYIYIEREIVDEILLQAYDI